MDGLVLPTQALGRGAMLLLYLFSHSHTFNLKHYSSHFQILVLHSVFFHRVCNSNGMVSLRVQFELLIFVMCKISVYHVSFPDTLLDTKLDVRPLIPAASNLPLSNNTTKFSQAPNPG